MSGAVIFVMAATLAAASANAQTTRYVVKLRPDFDRREFRGEEDIEFHGDAHTVLWKKQPGLKITKFAGGELTADAETVRVRLGKGGKHRLHFEYSVTAGRGLRWLDEGAGFVSAFYCDGWMICDDSPAQRATLRLEIALPPSSPLRVVGPGQLERSWRDKEGQHFLFEQAQPVQTYLFSFGAADLQVSSEAGFSIYAAANRHQVALRKTSEAAAFFGSKAGTEPMTRHYAQAFLPGSGLGQEAAGLAQILLKLDL